MPPCRAARRRSRPTASPPTAAVIVPTLVAGVRYDGGETPAIVIRYRDDESISADLRGKELRLRADLDADGTLSFSVAADSSLAPRLRPRLR